MSDTPDIPTPDPDDEPLAVGTRMTTLPTGRGPNRQLEREVKPLLDEADGEWVVIRSDVPKSGGVGTYKKAAAEWDGDYEFATRTINGHRHAFGRRVPE